MSLNSTDVLVVGGGPAGLMAARAAAASGVDVLLVEREVAIGTPVHTSGATALSTMHEFRIPQSLYHPIQRVRLCSLNESATFQFQQPVGCVIDVRGVYRYLGGRAAEAGATVATGVQAMAPVLADSFVTGCRIRDKDDDNQISCHVLIDATGYRADMSKSAGLHGGFVRFGVGAEYELVAPHCNQEELLLIVGNRYAPAGYAWVFPWGHSRVRVGVGLLHADTKADPRRLLKVFLDEIQRFDVDIRGHEIVETHYGLIPAMGLAERLVGNGIVAVGDAAGVATLVVGEGIRLSMVSGQMAGNMAANAIKQGRYDRRALQLYETQFRKAFGFDLRLGGVLNRKMAQWTDEKWDDRVRFIQKLPSDLMVRVLQSHFSARHLLAWLLWHPAEWPRMLRWTAKAAVDYIGFRP